MGDTSFSSNEGNQVAWLVVSHGRNMQIGTVFASIACTGVLLRCLRSYRYTHDSSPVLTF